MRDWYRATLSSSLGKSDHNLIYLQTKYTVQAISTKATNKEAETVLNLCVTDCRHYGWVCALTALPTGLALWHCGQVACLAPRRPGFETGWGPCSRPSLTYGVRSGMATVRPFEACPMCEQYKGPPRWVEPGVRNASDGYVRRPGMGEVQLMDMSQTLVCVKCILLKGRAVWRSCCMDVVALCAASLTTNPG